MQLITLFISFLFFTSCALTGLFSKTGVALVTISTESGGISYNKGNITKTGEACSYNALGIVSFGNSGIESAKRYGGLQKVFYYDNDFTNILGLLGKVCTRVYGQ